MKEFLNKFSRKHREMSDETSHDMHRLFEDTISLIRDALGEKAFRSGRNLNAAVYEAVMVGLARRLRDGPALDPESVRESYEELFANAEFKSACEQATADESNVRARQALVTRAFAAAN